MAAGPAERWIVVLRDGSDSHRMAAEHSRAHGAQVDHVYRHALRGYAAVIPNERVAAVRSDARVAYLERDGVAIALAQTLPGESTRSRPT
jgi:subtilisin